MYYYVLHHDVFTLNFVSMLIHFCYIDIFTKYIYAVLCQPVHYTPKNSMEPTEMLLVDGGVMCNYPIQAFDGW